MTIPREPVARGVARVRRRIGQRARQALKLLRLLPNPVFRRGLRFGVGAAIEHRGVLASLSLETIVDVGAHTGQFSLLARELHPRARIVAFEPLPVAAARYRRLFAGDPNVTLHQVAIAPWRGTATMHVSASDDSSSLLPITPRQVLRFPGTEEREETTVETAPPDAFLAPADVTAPALLKIDVQGFELEVLRASRPMLGAFEHVYVEASFEVLYAGQALADDIAAFLRAHGFREAGRFNVTRGPGGSPVQADFLFHRVRPSGPNSGRAGSSVRQTPAAGAGARSASGAALRA